MASAFLLRRPIGALASAAGALSLSGVRDNSTVPTKDRTRTWWTGPAGGFRVSCEEETGLVRSKSVNTLVRRKSKVATAESWSQKQQDISKHVSFEELLAKSDVFQSCPPEMIKKLVTECGTKIFAKRGTKLISQDEINDKLFLVGHGSLVVEVDENRVATVGAGASVGEQAVLTLQKAKADVSVMSASSYLLVIEKSGLNKIIEEKPEVREEMLKIVSQREVKNLSVNLISQIPSFDNCSPKFMEALANSLKLVSFDKGEMVVQMNTSDDLGMFFIMTGDMGVYDAKGLVSTLGPNDFFGEAMLLSGPGAKRFATVQAESFVEAFQLPRKDFLKIGTQFPKDLDQMKKLAKERSAFLLNRKTSVRIKSE